MSDTEFALADLFNIINSEQTELTENLIDTRAAFDQAKESIRGFLDELDFGRFSTLSPLEQLERAQDDFNNTLARARIGDPEALSEITSAADRFLGLSRDLFASGPRFQSTLESVTTALRDLEALPIPEIAVPENSEVVNELQIIRDLVARAVDLGAGTLDFSELESFLSTASTLDPLFVDQVLDAVGAVQATVEPAAFNPIESALAAQTSSMTNAILSLSPLLAQIAINTGRTVGLTGSVAANTGQTVQGVAALFDATTETPQTQVTSNANSPATNNTNQIVTTTPPPVFTATGAFNRLDRVGTGGQLF